MKKTTREVTLEVAAFSVGEARAIRAVKHGVATPEQQTLALQWIVNGAGMFTGQSFVPGEPDRTSFNEGRRNVAKQIIHLTVCDLNETRNATKGD